MEIKSLDWEKVNGLIPVIVQDNQTQAVLMLGYMNQAALERTLQEGRVTFWSRAKERLWTKGETSGNFLELKSISPDCDNDTLLIQVKPNGPTCHTGKTSCFDLEEKAENNSLDFLKDLSELIQTRKTEMPQNSYTMSLFEEGLDKIIQKVGEEAIEVVIAGKNDSKQRFLEESADLFYHYLVLLAEKKIDLAEVLQELKRRHNN